MPFIQKSTTPLKSTSAPITSTDALLGGSSGLTASDEKFYQSLRDDVASSKTAVSTDQILATLKGVSDNPSGALTSLFHKGLASLSTTFDKNAKSLASSISGEFNGLFGDTSIKPASNPTTQTSDPVSSLLKTPLSKTFTLGSLQSGSTSTGGSGSVSTQGTLADYMVGTRLSTILDRFSLDSKELLGSVVPTKIYQDKLTGLFGNLTVTPEGVNAASTTAGINNITVDPKSAIFGFPQAQLNVTEALKDVSDVSNIISSVGGYTPRSQDLFSFYTENLSPELLNDNGDIVSTSKPLSASSANSVLGLIKQAGCALTTSDYASLFGVKSLFNISTLAAATNGMLQELTDLVTCMKASTPYGQSSLKVAVLSVANTDLQSTSILMSGISDTTSLQVTDVDEAVFTNTDLDKADATEVTSILARLNTTPDNVLTISDASVDAYPVWDAAILEKTQSSFMTAILQSPDMDNVINGSAIYLDSSGQFALA